MDIQIITETNVGTVSRFLDEKQGLEYLEAQLSAIKKPGEIKILYNSISRMILNTLDEFEEAILSKLQTDSLCFDEELQELSIHLNAGFLKMQTQDKHLEQVLTDATAASALILFEMKAILIEVIERWLKFYLKEFWVMIEIGVKELETYQLYVYEDLKNNLSLFRLKEETVRLRLKKFTKQISMKVQFVDH
jgi:hypothetical protein